MMSRRSLSFVVVGSPLTTGSFLKATIFTSPPSLAFASSFRTLWYLDDSKNTLCLLEWDQIDRLRGGIGKARDCLRLFGEVRVRERASGNPIIGAWIEGH